MKNFNYRTTVNISDQILTLGFRCSRPEDMREHKIRVQAVFTQRNTSRRIPMEVSLVEGETGPMIHADAKISLPYVFLGAPKRKVVLTFALWYGVKEYELKDQPFPLRKELFYEKDGARQKQLALFGLYTLSLPFMVGRAWLKNNRDLKAAARQVNAVVEKKTGYSYSPRQRNTDYFASQYKKAVRKSSGPQANKVLFLSEREPEEGGNLMLLKERMSRDDRIEIEEFINTRTVDLLSKQELKDCAQACADAKVIILEDFYPQLHALRKRGETRIVQLWHACGAFKTFGLTRIGKQGGAPEDTRNHRSYDFVTVSSESIRDIYAEAFGISSNRVHAMGVPRTDFLFDLDYEEEKKKAIYEKYPMIRDKKVVLFAPTFRGDGNKDAYYPKDAFDINAFMSRMDEDTFLIVKHHPFVDLPLEVDDAYRDRVLDLTRKDHIDDLMLICNLLITDYSSCIFEAALLDLPMLFYAFDEEEYIISRDFYDEYRVFAPGPVENTFEGMTEKAFSLLSAGEPVEYRSFLEDYLGALDGQSTERIYEYICSKMLGLEGGKE